MEAGIDITAAEQGVLFDDEIARGYGLGLDFATQSKLLEIIIPKCFNGKVFPKLEKWNAPIGSLNSQVVFALVLSITKW